MAIVMHDAALSPLIHYAQYNYSSLPTFIAAHSWRSDTHTYHRMQAAYDRILRSNTPAYCITPSVQSALMFDCT